MHLDQMPLDLCEEVVAYLSFATACRCRIVCRAWRAVMDAPGVDWAVARRYAAVVLGDARFWEHAVRRPVERSRPLDTWRAEIARIEAFARAGGKRPRAGVPYAWWAAIDGSEARQCHPPA